MDASLSVPLWYLVSSFSLQYEKHGQTEDEQDPEDTKGIPDTRDAFVMIKFDNAMNKNYFFPSIASLAALATRNFTTFLAGILIASPV